MRVRAESGRVVYCVQEQEQFHVPCNYQFSRSIWLLCFWLYSFRLFVVDASLGRAFCSMQEELPAFRGAGPPEGGEQGVFDSAARPAGGFGGVAPASPHRSGGAQQRGLRPFRG